ncbi:MAG: AAA family ATPase [Actinomycetota bacterium]|nr:AAA family ATPase [Actinomycetota bacterium]
MAERFVNEALRSDGSLFTPGGPIWSAENIKDLYDRFVRNPIETSESFEEKFRRQLKGAPLETKQLAAELLYVYLLFPSNIGGDNKRRIVRKVLDGTSIAVPDKFERALEHGMANFGPSLNYRPWQLTMLLEFLRKWKSLPEREEALSDPWKFKEIVFSVPHERAGVQREALLHLAHPDTFERIVSRDQKQDVAKRFSYLTGKDTRDVDQRILEIREGLSPKYGEDFDFYDPEVKQLWTQGENPWDGFVRWAGKFYEWEGFDENERDYKLQIAADLKEAKDALLTGEEAWTKELKEAFGSQNNLTHWRQSQPFLKWCEKYPEIAQEALRSLWNDSVRIFERIGSFSELLPKEVLSGRGGRLALASVLSLADDPLNNPVYRWAPLDKAQKLLDYPVAEGSLDEAELYRHTVEFVDRFVEEAESRGLELRDRLDAQSLIWCVSKWNAEAEPVSTWKKSERAAFLAYRGEAAEDEPWWKPLEHPFGLEAELQEILAAGATEHTKETLGAIFRRAILLHQSTGTEGFLGPKGTKSGTFSVMAGSLLACGADSKLLYLLVDNDTDLRKDYEVGECLRVNNELMWLHINLSPTDLQAMLEDERAWAAYERMLEKFPSLSTARSNHLNVGKTSVVTGKRYGGGEAEDLGTLAQELLLDHGYLLRVERLLKDKRQLIFYGPPGTGKTFVARRLARLYGEGGGGSSLLVQFHPSYSYEDFVEGYRPRDVNGQPGFALVDGPLKKLARKARENPDALHVLVIDEVNRANLTKVLGELYFLLEYRDEGVSLQYSEEGFSLPDNLWIICTMNTADRSIALVDAALRRRFYFTPFFPDEPPVEGLLRRWLEERNPALLWVADVVDEANRRLGDRDAAVGPSYFLREDLSEEWVEIIWEHAVLPYLSEQFFDEEKRLGEFTLPVLRSAVAGAGEGDAPETPTTAS